MQRRTPQFSKDRNPGFRPVDQGPSYSKPGESIRPGAINAPGRQEDEEDERRKRVGFAKIKNAGHGKGLDPNRVPNKIKAGQAKMNRRQMAIMRRLKKR